MRNDLGLYCVGWGVKLYSLSLCTLISLTSLRPISHGLSPTRQTTYVQRMARNIWNCCDGNKLHAINPIVGVTKQNDPLSRRDAVILNRLQIGHTRATHAHLLGDDEAFCATCYTSLTVNHILIDCPQFNYLRQQYHFGSTLKELFSNTPVLTI